MRLLSEKPCRIVDCRLSVVDFRLFVARSSVLSLLFDKFLSDLISALATYIQKVDACR